MVTGSQGVREDTRVADDQSVRERTCVGAPVHIKSVYTIYLFLAPRVPA